MTDLRVKLESQITESNEFKAKLVEAEEKLRQAEISNSQIGEKLKSSEEENNRLNGELDENRLKFDQSQQKVQELEQTLADVQAKFTIGSKLVDESNEKIVNYF